MEVDQRTQQHQQQLCNGEMLLTALQHSSCCMAHYEIGIPQSRTQSRTFQFEIKRVKSVIGN